MRKWRKMFHNVVKVSDDAKIVVSHDGKGIAMSSGAAIGIGEIMCRIIVVEGSTGSNHAGL
ncbi:unnamed protein product [Prunus brigantina]